jgi:hypothetical protein
MTYKLSFLRVPVKMFGGKARAIRVVALHGVCQQKRTVLYNAPESLEFEFEACRSSQLQFDCSE